MTSRFFSGSRSIAGLRSDAFSSFTSPFLFSPVVPPTPEAMLLGDTRHRDEAREVCGRRGGPLSPRAS